MASGVSRWNRPNEIPVLCSAAVVGFHTRGLEFASDVHVFARDEDDEREAG
ncbi:MAG: hypothetical protein PVF26_06130 [Desulfobacterales bacterium]|jgi:hypothetical protein